MPQQGDVISSGRGQEFLNCWRRALSEAHWPADQPDAGESFAASEPRRWSGDGAVDAVVPPGIAWHVREHQVGPAPGDEGPAAGRTGMHEHEVKVLAEMGRDSGGGDDRVGEGAAHAVQRPGAFDVPAVLRQLANQHGGRVVVHRQQDRVLQLGAVQDHRASMDRRDEKVYPTNGFRRSG